jgi:hypothetical protein
MHIDAAPLAAPRRRVSRSGRPRSGDSRNAKFPDLIDIDHKLAVAAVIYAPRPASM